MSLRLSANGFAFAIQDQARGKFIALEAYDLGQLSNAGLFTKNLKAIINQHALLRLKFGSVNVAVANAPATLVPAAVYEESTKHKYLAFNHQLEARCSIHSDRIRPIDAWNVYAVPNEVYELMQLCFPGFTIRQSSTSLLTAALAQFKHTVEKTLILHIQSDAFEIIVTENNRLNYYNLFKHQSPEDLMYFLMFVCEEVKLNPEQIDTVLVGELEKKSLIYNLLHKYFRNLRFGARSDSFQYSYGFDELPKHYYYNLLSQQLCV